MELRTLIVAVGFALAVVYVLAESTPDVPARPVEAKPVPDCYQCQFDECPDCPVELRHGRLAPLNPAELPHGAAQIGVGMDLPPQLREPNYAGGSCGHASTTSLLRHQQQYELADWWRATYSSGEYSTRHIERLEAAGLRYAYTTTGDMEFLKYCARTRRGAVIYYKPYHIVNFVGVDLNRGVVQLLDNNDVNRPERAGSYEEVEYERFAHDWKHQYGGFAFTLIYQPAPARPAL